MADEQNQNDISQVEKGENLADVIQSNEVRVNETGENESLAETTPVRESQQETPEFGEQPIEISEFDEVGIDAAKLIGDDPVKPWSTTTVENTPLVNETFFTEQSTDEAINDLGLTDETPAVETFSPRASAAETVPRETPVVTEVFSDGIPNVETVPIETPELMSPKVASEPQSKYTSEPVLPAEDGFLQIGSEPQSKYPSEPVLSPIIPPEGGFPRRNAVTMTRSELQSLLSGLPTETLVEAIKSSRLSTVHSFIQDDSPQRSHLTMNFSDVDRLKFAASTYQIKSPQKSQLSSMTSRASAKDVPRQSTGSTKSSYRPKFSVDELDEPVSEVFGTEPQSKTATTGADVSTATLGQSEESYTLKELNEATKKAIEVHRMLQEKTKRIEELKSRLNFIESKTNKTVNDPKHIKLLKCELECSFKRFDALLQEFKRLNKDVVGYTFPPIRIPTTLAEDALPNQLGIQISRQFKPIGFNANVVDQPKSTLNLDMCRQIADDNVNLTTDRVHLQTEILEKDRIIENLQQNLHILQSEITRMRINEQVEGNQPGTSRDDPNHRRSSSSRKLPTDIEKKLKCYRENTDKIERNIARMGRCLEQMQCHIDELQKERCICESNRSKGCRRIGQLERELESTRKEAMCRIQERESVIKQKEAKIKVMEANLEDAKRKMAQLRMDMMN